MTGRKMRLAGARTVLCGGAMFLSAAFAGCAGDGDTYAELPDHIREDKARIAQGLPPEHHRTKRHVRAAEEGWHRERMFDDHDASEADQHIEAAKAAYERDQAERDFR